MPMSKQRISKISIQNEAFLLNFVNLDNTTYTGDSETCLRYIGSSGKCEEGLQGKCQARKCESAPKLYSTDEQCKSYSSKCKTTGIGCVSILLKCNSYKGTRDECEKRRGADGKCTGGSYEQSQECKARICSDALLSTDSECSEYQNGCISNGVECTLFLMSCSKYIGDSDKCNKYVGTEGKCTLGENGYCTIKLCETANLKTNEECKGIQSYCLTDGFKCVKTDTCLNTLQKITCQETVSLGGQKCQWTEQCVSNQCGSLLTKGICMRYSTNVQCFWDGISCVEKQCKHATQEFKNDTDCSNFLPNCIYNGKGCVDIQSPCEEYFGDEDIDFQFIILIILVFYLKEIIEKFHVFLILLQKTVDQKNVTLQNLKSLILFILFFHYLTVRQFICSISKRMH